MRRLPPLASLRSFEAAARHLSFKKAAEELAVTPTAISHQVRLLEEVLGRRLFERRTRHVVLTEAGRMLFPALRDGFDLMSGAVDRVTARPQRPSVTITTTEAFAAHWLVPRLAAFRKANPDVGLSILASDDVVNLESGKADLAIRLAGTPPPEPGAVALFHDRYAPVASPALSLKRLADLKRVPLIQFDWHRPRPDFPTWARWFSSAGLGDPGTAPQLHFSEESHALQAAIAGQGVALFSLTLASLALQQGLLVQPFGTAIPGPTYFLVGGRDGMKPPVAAVRDWLIEQAWAARPLEDSGNSGARDRAGRAPRRKG